MNLLANESFEMTHILCQLFIVGHKDAHKVMILVFHFRHSFKETFKKVSDLWILTLNLSLKLKAAKKSRLHKATRSFKGSPTEIRITIGELFFLMLL